MRHPSRGPIGTAAGVPAAALQTGTSESWMPTMGTGARVVVVATVGPGIVDGAIVGASTGASGGIVSTTVVEVFTTDVVTFTGSNTGDDGPSDAVCAEAPTRPSPTQTVSTPTAHDRTAHPSRMHER